MLSTQETLAIAARTAQSKSQTDFLTVEEIEQRMEKDGFAEMRWLWRRFVKSAASLADIDDAAVERSRRRHMGLLISSRAGIAAISLTVATVIYLNYGNLFYLDTPTFFDWLIKVLFSMLTVYLFWFTVTGLHRTFIHSWKAISARDLAAMLRRRSYREWFDATNDAGAVTDRLRQLGVNDRWDDPGYRVWYEAAAGDVRPVERLTEEKYIHQALQEVLGSKQDRVFQPGRYLDSLKNRKKSVTRLVKAHQEQLKCSREGDLAVKKGRKLLEALRRCEIIPGSAGDRYLADVITALKSGTFLPKGTVEAYIWTRDPWVDLTHSRDFYSSASLRGNSFMDALERRSKGMLGPFGYLRNKSISAMDFRTSEGRSIRARLAAATACDGSNLKTVLFVDAVEGRFDIKPGLLRRALEDYARAAGFDMICYYAFPLNRVPMRIVHHLARSDARLEELNIRYVDASKREYLDAFSLPLEPFEYAYPAGRAIGYCVDTGGGLVSDPVIPGKFKLCVHRLSKKGFLWALIIATSTGLGWVLYRVNPAGLLPAAILVGLAMLYELVIRPRLRLRIHSDGNGDERPTGREPKFLQRIRKEIAANPVAVKMSYPDRLDPKVKKLLAYFEKPGRALAPFFEVILFNAALKDSHIENMLKFMKKIQGNENRKIAKLFPLLWPERDDGALKTGLSEDKKGRTELIKQVGARVDIIRKYVKGTPAIAWDAKTLRSVARTLKLKNEDAFEIVGIRPRILRGLRKPPRPIYSWILPVIIAIPGVHFLTVLFPSMSALTTYLLLLTILAGGVWILSTRLAIAPGILCYEKTRRRLNEAFHGHWKPSGIVARMTELGIVAEAYFQHRLYENREHGIRIEIRDKRTLKGAMQFLTSSEEIGNCIALRNFVSWCLPSLLDDEGIMLADISCKGRGRLWQQRAQLWMVASEKNGTPVLAVNSVEFNNEGVKYFDILMPEIVNVMRDVARRAGFKEICVGISDFGRQWFDRHYPQGTDPAPITKIHSPELGFKYYFDSFRLKRLGPGGRRWEYMKKRTYGARSYAVVFGILELLKGNRAKSGAFLDAAKNLNNFWVVPLDADE
jgi:hypothetical protein